MRLIGRGDPRVTPLKHDFVSVSLLTALKKPGCVFCRLVAEGEERWLWGFLWENVNDPWIRERIAASWGLCRSHAWMLVAKEQAEWGNGLGTAIVYRDLAGRFLEAITSSNSNGSWWTGFFLQRAVGKRDGLIRRLSPRQPCPLCDHAEWIVESEIYWLPAALANARFRKAYSDSEGLCLPHLRQALSRVISTVGRSFLLDHQERVLQAVAQGSQRSESRLARVLSLLGGEKPVLLKGGEEYRRVTCCCSRCVGQYTRAEQTLRNLAASIAGADSEMAEKWQRLCSRHLWETRDYAVGTVGEKKFYAWCFGLVADGLERLMAAPPYPFGAGWRRLIPWTTRGAPRLEVSPCPVCTQQDALEAEEADQEDTLCLPHLRGFLGTGGPGFNGVLTREDAFVRPLVAELDEYMRKHDYRFADEPRGAEQTSWRRAVAFLAGADPRCCHMAVTVPTRGG